MMTTTLKDIVAQALSPCAWEEKPEGYSGTQAEWDAGLEEDRAIARSVAEFVLSSIQSSGTYMVVPVEALNAPALTKPEPYSDVKKLRIPIEQSYMPASSEPDGDALWIANQDRAKAADIIEALHARAEAEAEARGRIEKLGKLISAYDQAHERIDRGEKWIDIWQDYFVEKHSYKYWAGYMQQSILNAARAVCETRALITKPTDSEEAQ